jgi:uncharacterized protein
MPWRHNLLEFIAALRAAGMRISVAESLDAMHAAMTIGLAERSHLHEAFTAALLKDESERRLFDDTFTLFFGGGPDTHGKGGHRHSRSGLTGIGGASGGTGAASPEGATPVPPAQASAAQTSLTASEPDSSAEKPQSLAKDTSKSDRSAASSNQGSDAKMAGDAAARSDIHSSSGTAFVELLSALTKGDGQATGTGIFSGHRDGHAAHSHEAERRPFTDYTDLEYRQARDTLAILQRRLRTRLARRLRIAPTGRIDFRRTVRAAIQHGGTLMELRRRDRRPRHLDLILLGDVSGSMRYAAVLTLELVAGAREFFRHVRSFVYIDSLAEAGFESGHLAAEPAIDFHARSDFGKVLAQLWARRAALITRATVIVVIGDGRNNRRPARAELLRDLRRHCRAVIWLNPERPERWGTGDSAILNYSRHVNHLIFCGNLVELEHALGCIV